MVVVADGPLRTGPQVRSELPYVQVCAVLVLQLDVPPGVVLNPGQGEVDLADPVYDVLPAAVQERVERHHLVDGVLVQGLLEVGLETREIVADQLLQQFAEVGGGLQGGVDLGGLVRVFVPELGHEPDSLLGGAGDLLGQCVDGVGQPGPDGTFHGAGVLVGERFAGEFSGGEPGHCGQHAAVVRQRRLPQDVPAVLDRLEDVLGRALVGADPALDVIGPHLQAFQLSGKLGFLRRQLPQHIAGGFQLGLLCLELLDAACGELPAELGEVGHGPNNAQLLVLPADGAQGIVDPGQLAGHHAELALDLVLFGTEAADLVQVVPAQDVVPAVREVLAVILLVPAAAALELAVGGEGLGTAAEILQGVTAEIVEAAAEFVQQEIAERRALLDGDLRRQCSRLGRFRRVRFADLQVHQPAAQVVAVHPAAHRRVVLRRHQKRQRKAAQGAFGGAFPGRFAVADAQQLAGVRQVGFLDAGPVAEPTAELHLGARQQVGARLQAGQLRGDVRRAAGEHRARHGQFGAAVLYFVGAGGEFPFDIGEPGPVGVELDAVRRSLKT